eukprot:superscaffoldBa00004844_g19519
MLETGTESALVAERRVGRRQRRLFSCHIISDRAVNKGPLRPPGRCTAACKSVHGSTPPSPLRSTAVNNGDIVRPPVLSLGPGRRLLNWLYSSRAK